MDLLAGIRVPWDFVGDVQPAGINEICSAWWRPPLIQVSACYVALRWVPVAGGVEKKPPRHGPSICISHVSMPTSGALHPVVA